MNGESKRRSFALDTRKTNEGDDDHEDEDDWDVRLNRYSPGLGGASPSREPRSRSAVGGESLRREYLR